ncbi:MAG TPA: TolC family protein [Thermoanaerobaculia bacterium]|nr:TolC family protein [Thermoanaerobaculia bacterium]
MKWTLITIAFTLLLPSIGAQELTLGALHEEAQAADPRLRQLELEARQSELRLRNLAAERRPSLSVEGQVQYQSDVVEFPFAAPGGGGAPSPPKDTYDAYVRLEQSILDPSLRARVAAEGARAAEAQARVETALFGLRQEVNEAFFAAALLQEREAQIGAAITDLEVRLRGAHLRVAEGVALPSEPATIEAALLARRQDALQLRAQRRAALGRLAELTGRHVALDQSLPIPDLAATVAAARARLDELRERPEYEQFARARERLEAQKDLVRAQEEPRLSAYGRAGYGKPGLNFLSDDFDAYWLAGIRLQWRPFNWGATGRERRQLELQQESIAAEEETFTRALRRSLQNDLATIDHLAEVLALDERIVGLREEIDRETKARFDERVVTAAELVDKNTDVVEARLLRAAHRVELAQAHARLLTLLGLETR